MTCPEICCTTHRERLKAIRRNGLRLFAALSIFLLVAPMVIGDEKPERVIVVSDAHHAHDPNRTPTPSEAMLACIRQYETGGGTNPDGDYTANGRYKGAYQFDQKTWDGAAKSSIHKDWIGRNPASAPHEIQDSMASHLYRQRGLQPWPTPAKRCKGR